MNYSFQQKGPSRIFKLTTVYGVSAIEEAKLEMQRKMSLEQWFVRQSH